MYLRRDQFTRIARAPAKLNLYLEVLGRRADGFHELETLMVPVSLTDSLEWKTTLATDGDRPAPIALEVHECFSGHDHPCSPEIPTGDDNLVIRALKLLREHSQCRMGANIRLVKRIPAAAGLGGGSSDAAAALRLANRAWGLDWPTERLAPLAEQLGSDVPFFLQNGPAICRGRGEKVEPEHGMPRLDLVIVKPPADLRTADVYRAHDSIGEAEPARPKGLQLPSRAEIRGRSSQWMGNRLQAAAAMISPWVERLRSAFDKLDFIAHQLSGSGSAYFGVCRHAQHARRLAMVLRKQRLGLVYATRSCA